MKVALIVDVAWLRHEARLLQHLAVGLTDESVRIVSVLPSDQQFENLSLLGNRVDYHEARFRWLSHWRLRRLGHELAGRGVELIHALDGDLCSPAAALADALEVPVVCSVWSMSQAGRAVASGSAVLTPITPITQAIQTHAAPEQIIQQVHPGVMRPSVPAPLTEPRGSLNCLMFVDGKVDASVMAALAGVAEAVKHTPQLQVFIYCCQPDVHKLWQAVTRLGLLERVNLVGADIGSQGLAIRADLLMIPQPIQTIRTLPIAAMAAGRPVFAAPSEVADFLIHGQTARLIDSDQSEGWADAIDQTLGDTAGLIELGQSAQAYVRENFGPARYVSGVLDAYRQAVGEPLKFEA